MGTRDLRAKMWKVGLWVSKNVRSRTLGSTKCGKWDFQDAVFTLPPPLPINVALECVILVGFVIVGKSEFAKALFSRCAVCLCYNFR